MSSLFLRSSGTALLLGFLCACTSDATSGSDVQPPDALTLFPTPDLAPTTTPDKLRGVWQNSQAQTNGTIDLRIRFIERYVVGAARCTATNGPTVIAGGSIGLDTADLDSDIHAGKTGKITFGTLGLLKEENGLHCEVALPGNTYVVTIAEDGSLSFTTGDAKLSLTFKKIAD